MKAVSKSVIKGFSQENDFEKLESVRLEQQICASGRMLQEIQFNYMAFIQKHWEWVKQNRKFQ